MRAGFSPHQLTHRSIGILLVVPLQGVKRGVVLVGVGAYLLLDVSGRHSAKPVVQQHELVLNVDVTAAGRAVCVPTEVHPPNTASVDHVPGTRLRRRVTGVAGSTTHKGSYLAHV